MADSLDDDDDEKPLDPAVARVQERLRRLILISGLTLGLGIFAVFAAIVYRLVDDGDAGPAGVELAIEAGAAVPTIQLTDLGLDPSARHLSSALDGDRLALTFVDGTATTVVIVDLPTMTVVERLRIVAE